MENLKMKYSHNGYVVNASTKEEAIKKIKDILEFETYGMSNLFPRTTGLDVPIYVDSEGTYKQSGHGKRIKFKASLVGNNDSRTFSVMKLDGEVVQETLPKKVSNRISSASIAKIKEWVLNNSYALSKLADKMIDIADFLSVMIKGKATKDKLEEQKKKVDAMLQ